MNNVNFDPKLVPQRRLRQNEGVGNKPPNEVTTSTATEPANTAGESVTLSGVPAKESKVSAPIADLRQEVAPAPEGKTTPTRDIGSKTLLMLESAEPAGKTEHNAEIDGFLTQFLTPAPSTKSSAAQAMSERESGYLQVFPHKNDEAAIKSRNALTARYNDPTTSAESITSTMDKFAEERGIDIKNAPASLVGALSGDNLGDVKAAAQGVVDKLFLSKDVSFNPEKHATVTKQTSRFLDLAMEAAPEGFAAADAYKLVASNLALISYQDRAAAENMLGDHGVRHLLGHNIKTCEQLADGLEGQGVKVGAMDRLVMHQAMVVHDLGYAMDSVRNSINSDGLKGQDHGHNVLAARYLRERSQNPDDPLAKLFGQGDLERMHQGVLYHDKDASGGPGVEFKMTATPTEEERATNIETMIRVADNSHAFEDKLPELLYRKPDSMKTLRLMKTAGELGDKGLVETLKSELADQVKADSSLAKDDREALLQSVSSVNDKSYKFSVGRIAGSKPTFGISAEGKVSLEVTESDTHQQTVGLFGLASYNQMEKFILDCAGKKHKMTGQTEEFEGPNVVVRVKTRGAQGSIRALSATGAQSTPAVTDAFNAELHRGLLDDAPFVKYSLLDTHLSLQQAILEEKAKLGATGLEEKIGEVKAKRQVLLDGYRANA